LHSQFTIPPPKQEHVVVHEIQVSITPSAPLCVQRRIKKKKAQHITKLYIAVLPSKSGKVAMRCLLAGALLTSTASFFAAWPFDP
jgi:hypothetical protein